MFLTRAKPVVLLAAVLAVSVAQAAPKEPGFPLVSITAGFAGIPVVNQGSTFFKAQFRLNVTAGVPVILAGSRDLTGQTQVDDELVLTVVHPDGTTASWIEDYNPGCGFLQWRPPVDVTSVFQPGVNKVHVSLRDACGGEMGANSQLWLGHD
jgi:hypothetical protein